MRGTRVERIAAWGLAMGLMRAGSAFAQTPFAYPPQATVPSPTQGVLHSSAGRGSRPSESPQKQYEYHCSPA